MPRISRHLESVVFARAVAVAVALAFALTGAQAARSSGPTNVSGTINTNTTWTAANSPYVMTGNVLVASGVTLTIEAGVTVKGNSSTRLLQVSGSLSAVGSASQPITFTSSSDSAAGQWAGIQFLAGAGSSSLQYVNARYGGGAGASHQNGMVDISGGTVTLADSSFTESSVSGVSIYGGSAGGASTVTVQRSRFIHNGYSGSSLQGDGLFANNANVTIRDSAFWSNAHDGLDYQVSSGYTASQASIAGSSIWSNKRLGVDIDDWGATTLAITGHVSGQPGNVIDDNGTFGFGPTDYWNQVSLTSNSPTLDWRGNYWGPVTYAVCPGGQGRLVFDAPAVDPTSIIPITRGVSNYQLDYVGGNYCVDDSLLVNEPLYLQPDLQFDPPPPTFGGIIPAAFWNCKDCVRKFAENAAPADAPGLNAAHNVGDPVNTSTGELFENATDLSLAGPGIPFTWMRSYNSADTGSSGLGRGWTDMFEAKITVSNPTTGELTYRAGSGQQTVFTKVTGGSSGAATYAAKAFDGTLKRQSDNTYLLTTRDQRAFGFDSSGNLTSIKPRFLPATTLGYTSGKLSSITDSAGRTITLSYSGALITSVALPDGRSVQYGYTSGLLTSVTDARGKVTTLTYDGNSRLTSIKDATNTYQVQDVQYDSQGRVTSEEDGAANATTYAYSNDGTYDLTTVTFPGHTGSLVYKQRGNLVFSVTDPLGRTTSYTYDAMARTATETDGRGYTTRFEYDQYGNVTKIVPPASLSYQPTTATYNATNDLLTQTDGRGNTTSYAYATGSDPAADYQVGQLKTITDRENGITTYKYFTSTSSPTPPTSNIGLAKSVTDPRSKTTGYGYDSSGNLTSITSPLGFKTTMTYDGSGRLTGRRDPRGNQVTPASGYLTEWSYDAVDHVSTLTDARGNVTSYAYLDSELPYTITRTDRGSTSRVTSFTYNSKSLLATTTDPRSGVESRLYWPDGSLKQVTSPASRVTTYSYDDADQLHTLVEPNGNATGATASDYTWTYSYDDAGNQTSAQHPDGGTSQIAYDALNRPNQWTDPNSHSSSATYDANGNVTQRTDALSHSTSYAYDKLDRLTSATNELGKTTTNTYFATGQLASVTTPLGNKTTYGLDDDGRVTSMVEPRGNVSGGTPSQYTWSYGYDAAGNRTSVTDPLSNQSQYQFDAVNAVTQVTDANNHAVSFTYDVLNRLWKVTPPAAGNSGTLDTVYVYDAGGNLSTRTDPDGHDTTWAYDLDGLQTQRTTALGSWNSSYDANGNVKTLETAAGSATGTAGDGTIAYSYDRMSRLTGVSYSDSTPSVSRGYDNAGRLTSMSDGAGSLSYSYDNADRLTDVTRSGGGSGLNGTFHYGYDDAGQITGRTYPDTTTTTASFDDDGRIASVASGGSTTSFGYDAAGNLTSLTLPSGNGYVESRSFDRAGRLTTVDNVKSGTSLSKFTWTLDPVGNPTKVDTLRGGTDSYDGYQYDARDRLTAACYGIASSATDCSGASDQIAYSYDKVDNLSQQVRTGSVGNTGTISYSYDAADELTSSSKGGTTTTYSYDGNGNQTGNGTNTFAYNLAGQLTSSTTGGTTSSYSYDGDGNRVSSSTPSGADLNYTWDTQADTGIPELALEQTSSGGLVRRYLNGPLGAVSMTNGGGAFYYHHDPHGNISDLTSSTGAAQWAYSYEPYGAARTANNVSGSAPENRLRYTGQYTDTETSQYNLRAREYDPATGRFGALDPLENPATSPYAAAYAYVEGQPTILLDPTGMLSIGGVSPGGWVGSLKDGTVSAAKGFGHLATAPIHAGMAAYRRQGGGFDGGVAFIDAVNPAAAVRRGIQHGWQDDRFRGAFNEGFNPGFYLLAATDACVNATNADDAGRACAQAAFIATTTVAGACSTAGTVSPLLENGNFRALVTGESGEFAPFIGRRATGLNGPRIISRIAGDPYLVRQAERAGRSVQDDLDRLQLNLAHGNLQPWIGSRTLFAGIREARSSGGARVYFRTTSEGIEILAKSSKANQSQVIQRLQELYGRR